MEIKNNRWAVLSSIMVLLFCYGGAYAWSVFSLPLATYHQWSLQDTTLAYSLLFIVLAITAVPSGKILDKYGPRQIAWAGAVLWGLGWFLTGYIDEVWQLYLTMGVCCGVADGLMYNASVSTCIRWFPDKRGLSTGLATGAAGIAPLFFAPFANYLLEGYGVLFAFKVMGIIFWVLRLSTVWLIHNPPEGYCPQGWQPETYETGEDGHGVFDKDWHGIIRDPAWYCVFLMLFGGATAGTMIISSASPIGQTIAGLTKAQAAGMVGMLAVASFVSRFIVGWLSDRIGRYKTYMLVMIISLSDMLLFTQVHSYAVFAVAIATAGFCYGANFVLIPSILSEIFGLKHLGLNYGITYLAFGIANFVGPMSAATFYANTQSYTPAFCIAAALAVMVFIINAFMLRIVEKRKRLVLDAEV